MEPPDPPEQPEPPFEPNAEFLRAMEDKRILSIRLEDVKRELKSTQRRYEQAMADLGKLSREAVSNSASGLSHQEVSDLRLQLQHAVEEGNKLASTLRFKKVQWKSKLETQEQEHIVATLELRKGFEAKILALKRELEEVQEPRPSTASVPPVSFSRFRCPLRLATLGEIASAALLRTPADRQGAQASFCREACWQLVSIVPRLIVIMCDLPTLKVIGVSGAAAKVWGSRELVGNPVMSLLSNPAGASWFRRSITTYQSLMQHGSSSSGIPGFEVHTAGCMEFRDDHGRFFEAIVVVAHLPADPRCRKGPSILTILERTTKPAAVAAPPSRASGEAGAGGFRPSEVRPRCKHSSAVGSVSRSAVSDDILPSDSASNMAMRY